MSRLGEHQKYTPAPRKYLCGVPGHVCSGAPINLNAGMRVQGGRRGHESPEAAFKCHGKYLISQGYERLSSREFRAPDGSGIRILTKPSHFGAMMRNGKLGTRNMTPDRNGTKAGVVASY